MKTIIIGAGILGASTAYHLTEKGEEVVVIDRNDPEQATRNAAGIVCPWLTNRSNQVWYPLVTGGAKYYPSLMEKLAEAGETQTGYKQVGAINIFDTEEKLEKKRKVALERKEQAPEMGEISCLSPKETKEIFPPVAEHYRALHISGGARVNGAEVTSSLLRAARKKGAAFISGEASFLYENERVEGVYVNGGKIFSDRVVVANGAWTKPLFEPLGMRPNVTFEKAQIVHVDMKDFDTGNWPVMLPPFNHYILSFGKGRVVIGATKEKASDSRVTAGSVHQLMDKALRVAPGLADATYVQTKVGFRPFTPGSTPVIGKVPGLENVVVANGLGASGLTSGPYIGAELAKYLVEVDTELDFSNYTADHLFK
ncbi:FAD-binding oxidoreductase [Halobacillus sp. HZG1]|uniref:NAD(P)/FAD-dependent oxidoreductase n=1 Tax=Halobacillus sp. HZG1 TaxID=3111769 RepID=UPI002DB65547|nr:FAD-binding oxidoreductase [Halobacillus sp. HZG1]MEC3884752.1 FAD-binding oxidoreductase [Halobacillus sp. HZG1]